MRDPEPVDLLGGGVLERAVEGDEGVGTAFGDLGGDVIGNGAVVGAGDSVVDN